MVYHKIMAVAPTFSLLLCGLCVSLAADWEFVDTNLTYFGDAIDYKDPCKAGKVDFTSSINVFIFCVSCCVCTFWLILIQNLQAGPNYRGPG